MLAPLSPTCVLASDARRSVIDLHRSRRHLDRRHVVIVHRHTLPVRTLTLKVARCDSCLYVIVGARDSDRVDQACVCLLALVFALSVENTGRGCILDAPQQPAAASAARGILELYF